MPRAQTHGRMEQARRYEARRVYMFEKSQIQSPKGILIVRQLTRPLYILYRHAWVFIISLHQLTGWYGMDWLILRSSGPEIEIEIEI